MQERTSVRFFIDDTKIVVYYIELTNINTL